MRGESQDTHEKRHTPAKCRGFGTMCIKKLTCLCRLPCEELIAHYQNLLFLCECKFDGILKMKTFVHLESVNKT